MKPNLIVLIPHFNSVGSLYESIISIQESIEIDLLIVDDGSLHKPNLEYLKSVYTIGEVFIEFLDDNVGIEKALNHGLMWIEVKDYQFIGRLDSGDLCLPNRFEKQLNYLNKNSDVMLLGTWVEVVDEHFKHLYDLKHPVSYEIIQQEMYINTVFVHPSVVFRSEVLNEIGYYPENYKSAEDYAYFFKIIKKLKAENYPEILLQYVIDPNSISSTKRKQQVSSRIKIILSHFKFGIYPIYGLLRSCILYFFSREDLTSIKKIFMTKKKKRLNYYL